MKLVINDNIDFEKELEKHINYNVSKEDQEKIKEHFSSDIIQFFIEKTNLNEKYNVEDLIKFLYVFLDLVNKNIENDILVIDKITNSINFNEKNEKNEKLEAVNVIFKLFPEEFFIRKCLEDLIQHKDTISSLIILSKIIGTKFLKDGWIKIE